MNEGDVGLDKADLAEQAGQIEAERVVESTAEGGVPTIVFHCIHDRLVPFDQGRRLAASIPNARFVALDSENHALLADEPAWAKFVEEVEAFLLNGS